jgi:hypothetical protein
MTSGIPLQVLLSKGQSNQLMGTNRTVYGFRRTNMFPEVTNPNG